MTRVEKAALEVATMLRNGTCPAEFVDTPRQSEWDYVITISAETNEGCSEASERLAIALTELEASLKDAGYMQP